MREEKMKSKDRNAKVVRRSKFKEVWRRLKKSRTAMIGLVILIIISAAALIGPMFIDYEQDVIKQNIRDRLQGPSWSHPFGTDDFGRDIFSRIVYGARTSLLIGIVSCAICCTTGVFLGAVAGYYGGALDQFIMRFFDIFLALPSILLAITIMAAFGCNLFNIIIAVGVVTIPQYARITRASVLTVINQEYIEAAKAVGAGNFYIITHHVLPNCFAPIMVQATLRVATVISSASSLSFLGLGIQPPAPEWGAMLSSGRAFLRDTPHLVIFPGLAIMLTILSLNLLGDGLRDALDPKLKK